MITYPNLYHLKYFVDAVALGSVSGAAHKNLVSHPAISRAILAIERHLGVLLLEHQKKSFRPTQAGFRVAEQAQALLSAASDFEKMRLTSNSGEVTELKIGITRTLVGTYLTPLLSNLREKFPKTTAKIRFGTTQEIVEAVANRSIDLGLTIGNLKFATLDQTVLKKGQFQLVESRPTGARSKKDREEPVESKAFLLTEPRFETEILKSAFQKYFDRPLPVLVEISSWEVIGQLVQKGLGVGLLPDISTHTWKANSYRILKTPWFRCSYEVYVHSLSASSPSRVLAHAKGILRSTAG